MAEEEKKKRKYTKHPKIYNSFQEGIESIMIPTFEKNSDKVLEIAYSAIKDINISKDDWKFLLNVVKEISAESKDMNHMITYNERYLEKVKYSTKHSDYYKVTASTHIKYFIKHIEKANKLNKDTEKEQYIYFMNLALDHLFFFMVAKEKI